jgi:hypothetical protein
MKMKDKKETLTQKSSRLINAYKRGNLTELEQEEFDTLGKEHKVEYKRLGEEYARIMT